MIPHFHSPWWGLLLLLLLVAMIFAWRRRPATLRVASAAPFARVAGKRRLWHPLRIPLLLYAVGLALLVIALMRSQKGIEKTINRAEGIDIMLALDVSGSMEAYDLGPEITNTRQVYDAIGSGIIKSRIKTARAELEAFIDRRANDRIGLIAFARLPYVVCPPTLDHGFLGKSLDWLDAGKLPDGTGIAAPITSATNRLKDSAAQRRVLVLFTDGDNNVEAAVSPVQAAKLAATFEVIVYTVGVGSRRSVMVLPSGRLRAGVAGFNRQLLETIAETTGGRYFEAKDAQGFKKVMAEIDELEKTSLEQPVYIDYREHFPAWLTAGLAVIIAAFVLEHTILMRIP